jgi:Ran-binding protein 3
MSAASEEKDVPAASHSEVDLIKEDAITASDNDTAEPERPVRRKLQETRITSEGNHSVPSDDDRGRLKKRSRDDLQAEEETTEQQTDNGHRRKRSRDANDDDNSTKSDIDRTTTPEPTNNDDASAHILSPKKKRSLDQLQENGASAQSEERASIQENEKERETKRHRDASQDRKATTVPPVKVTNCSTHSVI